MLIWGIIIGIIILVLLIVVHELGHAIVARRNGVVVKEFGIGFPPRAWKKKLKNGILLTLNWLPIGGFVMLKGEYDSAKGEGTYGGSSFWVKTKILFAGVVVNWLVAAALFSVLAVFGMPKILPNQVVLPFDSRVETSKVTVGKVVEGGAAAQAGLETGDVIYAVESEEIDSSKEFVEVTRAQKGQTVSVDYERDGRKASTEVALGSDIKTGVFGAVIMQNQTIYSTWSAPLAGIVTTGQFSWETLSGVVNMAGKFVSGLVGQLSIDQTTREVAKEKVDEVANSVAGPVGILGVIFPSAQQQGVKQIVLVTALISLTLAVMNALPIPGLDGGRWTTMAVFRLMRKKLTREREQAIQATGFLILFSLIILVTVADVLKLW